jgi:hypothetical protein
MSIIQRLEDDEILDTSLFELYSILGENDTPRLFDEPYTVNTDHDISFGAGNSTDRRTKYIDHLLYEEIMDGEFNATGLDPQQLIGRFLDHEHCEKCIVDGDNPVDTYEPGHKRALRKEHEGVLAILGKDDGKRKIAHYETVIWPGLVRCYNRPVKNPPLDLWCGPILGDPTEERDQEIIAQLRKLGVKDAGKRSKYEVHYGFGKKPCIDCRHYDNEPLAKPQRDLAPCMVTSGLVRMDRHCDFWMKK